MVNLLKKLFGVKENKIRLESTNLNIYDLYLDMFARYDSMVKPLIDSGRYEGATFEIRDITFVLKEHSIEIAKRRIGSGYNYYIVADQLADKMSKGVKPSDEEFMELEAYRRQVLLHINNAKRGFNNH